MIHVIWSQDIVFSPAILPIPFISYAKSKDNGRTFIHHDDISVNPARNHQMAILGRNVYMVWSDLNAGNSNIFLVVSRDDGVKFTQPQNISQQVGGNFLNSHIECSQGNVYIVWDLITASTKDIFLREVLIMANHLASH